MLGRGSTWRLCAIVVTGAAALLLAGASSAAPPDNDNFSAAIQLNADTGSYFGTNSEATKETGEPDHAGNVGGASVWYKWVAPYSGDASVDTFGSGLDTLLAVYTGSSVDALTLVAQNDDALGWKWTSKLGFAATAGTTYYIALDGYNDGTNGPAHGTFSVNWNLDAAGAVTQANDNFAAAVAIDGPGGTTTGSTFGTTKEDGEPAHAGTGGGRSVWFRWTAPYDGQFSFSTDGSSFNTVLAAYTGIAVNGLVQVAANDDIAWNNTRSWITFTATQGTVYSIAVDGWKASYSGTASGNYILMWQTLSASNGPANDYFVSAQPLTGASGAVNGSSVGAGKEIGEPQHAGNLGGASVWYSWTPTTSGNVDISTAGSSFDTLLAVYTGSAVGSLTQVAANDDIGPGKGASAVRFAATAGTTYRIAVDGYLAAGTTSASRGDIVLAWSIAASAPPANDSFASALTLTGVGGIVYRSTLGATKELGEPNHAGNPGGASAWFRWTAPGDGQWRFYTKGSTFNTLLGIYTGSSVDSLALVGSSDDISTNDRSSSVTIVARAQTQYWIAVDGYRGATGPAASGDYTFQWELLGPDPALAPNDDFASAWTLNGSYGPVTAGNQQSTKQAGEPDHAGNPGGASVWFKWKAPATGPVYFDTPGSSFDTLLAIYTGTSLTDLKEVAADDDIAYDHWWPNGHYRESFASFIAQQGTWYYIAVDGRAAPGAAPARGSIYLDWWLSPPPGDATLMAAGDISRCDGTADEATASILGQYPSATVAAVGDLAYENGSTAEYGCYDSSWGAAKSRTRPVPGDHDYGTPGAAPYFSYFGAAAGAVGKGYYSYELGGWHVIALNSNCDQVGGCGVGSAEEVWLRNDLRAHRNSCILTYMQSALYASSGQSDPTVKPFWQALYENGADVIIDGDSHYYERFAPQDPNGAANTTNGISEFIVGTGGAVLFPTPTGRLPNSQILNATTYGVLRLVLHTTGYDWQFMPAAGGTLTDSGRGTCAGGYTADSLIVAAPATPVPSASLSATGQFSVSWQPSPDIPTGATYSLFQRSTGSPTYTLVASGLTGTTYTFGATNAMPEGTWVYRVQAKDSVRTSTYSADSTPVKVDKSRPLPPTISPDRPADYSTTGWWKDYVTVTFLDNGDPALADGTAGSGVDKRTLLAPATYKTSGIFVATEQIADFAGNQSLTTSLTIRVDATPPVITLTCPTSSKRNRIAYATFTAYDLESGLATPATGYIRLDTSVKTNGYRASKVVSVDARDNVGHVSTATCSYEVT
jgi:hypothetical protein